jgi:GNAT superfamily N-acetyltransferase
LSLELTDCILCPLDTNNRPTSFFCGDDDDARDLSAFLIDDALSYRDQFLGTTTLIMYKNGVIGYFTLCASEVKLAGIERSLFSLPEMKVFPAIKLAQFALEEKYQRQGIGEDVIKYIIGLTINLNHSIGCRFVLVDANPGAVKFYQKVGFLNNQSYKGKKRKKPSLRLDIFHDIK